VDSRKDQAESFLQLNRKCLGMADIIPNLKELSQIVTYMGDIGLLNQSKVGIIHYFGSFNPFPHKGHIEIANMVSKMIEPNIRVVPTTTLNNPSKPELTNNLKERLENLHREFFNESYTSIIGLIGDFDDKNHRIKQLALLGSFD
jgi:hypothetical protein